MVRNSPENKLSRVGGWGWVAGSIETKTISASNLKLKLKVTEAELGNIMFTQHNPFSILFQIFYDPNMWDISSTNFL